MSGHNVYATYAVAFTIARGFRWLVAREAIRSSVAALSVEVFMLDRVAGEAAEAMTHLIKALADAENAEFQAITAGMDFDTPNM